MRRSEPTFPLLLTLLGGVLTTVIPSGPARAQALAFQPVVSSFPSGVQLWTQPVVSADRRYVRLGVNPFFTDLEGFNTYQVPAAVSGGGVGGAGGLGAGGGGFRSVSGGTFAAGMNGVQDAAFGVGLMDAPTASSGASAMMNGAGGFPSPVGRLSAGMPPVREPRTRTRAKAASRKPSTSRTRR